MAVALIYGGQGQQALKMTCDIIAENDWAQAIIKQANEILGYDLLTIITSEEEKLNQTKYTQPALFVANYIIQEQLIKSGLKVDVVAGLSLGEYNALVMAKVISFETALNIIKVRASLMMEAYDSDEVLMAAVLKADVALVTKTLNDSSLENMVSICNYNTNEQVVIGGIKSYVLKAIELLNTAGLKRVVPIEVSTISHSHLLNDTALLLEQELLKYQFNKPTIKFINNIAAEYQEDDFVSSLAWHIAKPTFLAKSIELMLSDNITTFIEVAPKKTISSFIKSLAKEKAKEVEIYHVYDRKSIKQTLESIGE